jgi:hypothetical protein
LTNILNTPNYPTEWQPVPFKAPEDLDNGTKFEYRKTTEDTYQVRSPEKMIEINKEGFDLLIDTDAPNKWNEWLRLNAEVVPRDD